MVWTSWTQVPLPLRPIPNSTNARWTSSWGMSRQVVASRSAALPSSSGMISESHELKRQESPSGSRMTGSGMSRTRPSSSVGNSIPANLAMKWSWGV